MNPAAGGKVRKRVIMNERKQPDAITERNQLRAEVARLNSEIETLKRAVDHFSTEKELIRRENVELRTQSTAAVRVADAVVNAWRVAKRRGSKAETLATLEAVDKAVGEYDKLTKGEAANARD